MGKERSSGREKKSRRVEEMREKRVKEKEANTNQEGALRISHGIFSSYIVN